MLEEQLKNEIAVKYFKKFVCTDIIKRIDFSVKNDYGYYLLWAEAKQQPTDIYRMLAQLLITIKLDAWDMTPPKFLGCFDSEKIAFVLFYDVQPVFSLNDFNWTQTPSQVDDKTVETVRNSIDKTKIFTFRYGDDNENIRNFIKQNFNEHLESNFLATQIDKNNFIFVYQKWRKAVMPYINAPWEKLKKDHSIYDCFFFLAELNIDDNGTADISDDKIFYEDFNITFDATDKKPYELLHSVGLDFDVSYKFGFKDGGLEHYVEFWKLYKRPPKEEIWKYIINRWDLLVPQDVRERKGAFFTPQIWVEKSQEYLADVLGADWQDDYYVWDCCAGTGNLLNGLTNKYHIFASTLDLQDVEVMRERIKNGANLLESHVFQFDFLNDDFSKCPQSLQDIIFDEEKRKKLVIYINPPYAEGDSRIGRGRSGVADSKIKAQYSKLMGYSKREVFIQFITRINTEIKGCKMGLFSTLVHLQGSKFFAIRNSFKARLEKVFVASAESFDNVPGKFPIGFQVWDLTKNEDFKGINAQYFDKKGIFVCNKSIISYDNCKYINDWTLTFIEKNKEYERANSIANIIGVSNDFQNQSSVCIENPNKPWNHKYQWQITKNNLIESCIYFSVRKCIEQSWINHYDQFLYPNDNWKTDSEFQTNCLVWTIFNDKNRLNSKADTNHWIPYSETEVNSKEMFKSHFMKNFIDGKIKAEKQDNDLFSSDTVETQNFASLQFGETANSVMSAGRELWRYYHTKTDVNPNASLYDIKEYFQGRNENGTMNSSSTDPIYTDLFDKLKTALRALREEIKPKVYEYGFLK
ncbi:MAG: hypothetical protein J6T70_20750 [Bacteroidales bacterium]|nr:hypothetical protein [Bacteroidales bacterium]